MRPAEVRFYIDADILGLAHVLAGLRDDVTYPGDPGATVRKRIRPPCPIRSPAVPDKDWIGLVAARGWLIITRDGHIQVHTKELAEVREHSAKMVALDTSQAHGTFDQLEIVMCRWRQIVDLYEQPGPFNYVASRTNLRRISLST
ncbi:PIN-like domain-containing protein [Phytohabitans kaempferiae]|uniref:VapC45 PIN like domain-containing protein n=1 Tax=Phytohabitans kaempferiae TaxID=1620943 RepID=A0ABV6MG34_9ACTN